jgi:lipoyl(octanoyl) transferase
MIITILGLTDYADACRMQKEAARSVASGGPERLFVLEHPPVITFGRNGGWEHLPFPPAYFEERGIQLVKSTRGGSVTCHFPGQLVAYPVMKVDRRAGGLRGFFHALEECAICTLARYGLKGERVEGRPGVWMRGRKICSTGIAVKHWITSHGLSLNVGRDISLFDIVNPCGLPGVRATSMEQELGGRELSMPEVKEGFVECFEQVFG